MRIHYIKHVKFEGLGHIARWAETNGHPVTSTALYAGEPFPDCDAFDCLIVMGGPMGVHDTDRYDWLTPEKYFIELALQKNKKALGICLGAQLIADVLGARVYPNDQKEIGWFPVKRTKLAEGSAFATIFPREFFAFHWHGDTFDIPQNAIHLAQSDATPHQAFVYDDRAVALQFHLESTLDSIQGLVHHCSSELVSAPYIQKGKEILEQSHRIAPSNERMEAVTDWIANKDISRWDGPSNEFNPI